MIFVGNFVLRSCAILIEPAKIVEYRKLRGKKLNFTQLNYSEERKFPIRYIQSIENCADSKD